MTTESTTAGRLMVALRNMRIMGMQYAQGRTVEGCTVSESMALFTLLRLRQRSPDGVKTSELSHYLRIASPSVTQMLNVLEARGLLERRPDPRDRRVVRVRLTEAGLAAAGKAGEAMLGANAIVEHLGEERSRQLIELLEDVAAFYRVNSKDRDKSNHGSEETPC